MSSYPNIPAFEAAADNLNRMGGLARSALADINDANLDEYREALRKMDWTFEFSDDNRVYNAGRRALAALHDMQAEVDPNGTLWGQVTQGIWGAAAPRVGIFAKVAA